ncbi:hypothetical protein DFA_11541 [Cavenderia fasciculata]|uniref:Major facilitator superfamily (MFS) profile domain-containing protein n=1 Tax=Cavenderia fasciculata TaxID=261658 RepID=F4QDI3_CACFS|nr:uncharacterized protein DFA_11541 [Cavenderia fasciculata]EGG13780.1 hypothetical protein DFA_11541 [Cavenderia fasciculata]|eukprot:XP_004350488.1 hypothetical protein DFA_11541 [Cavenderia fasciculata]
MDYENELLLYHSQHIQDNSFSDHLVVGRKTPRRFWIGLLITLLSTIGISINNESIYILALTISSYQIGLSIGKKAHVYISSNSKHWIMLIIALVVQLFGDIIYAAAPAQFLLLLSRFFVGLGNSYAIVMVQKMLSRSKDTDLQKMRLRSISTTILAAFPVAALLIAIVSNFSIDHRMNIFSQDNNTSSFYGWLVVIFSALSLILAIIGSVIDKSQPFDDDTDQYLYEEQYPIRNSVSYRTQESCIIPPKWTMVLLCIVHAFICNSAMVLESLFVPVTMEVARYGWDMTKVASFFIGTGVTVTITTILAKRITNNTLLFYGSILFMSIGYSFMIAWPDVGAKDVAPMIRYLLGALFISIGYPISILTSINIFYQLKLSVNSVIFGRLLGPIISIAIYKDKGCNDAFLYAMILSFLSVILHFSLGKSIKHINTVSVIQKNVPILSTEDENNKLFI